MKSQWHKNRYSCGHTWVSIPICKKGIGWFDWFVGVCPNHEETSTILTDTLPVIGSQLTAGTWKWFPPPKKKGKTSNQIINSWVQHVTFRGCKSSCKDVLFTNTNPQKTVQNHDSRIFSRRKTMNTRLKKVGKTGLMIFFDENVSRELFKSWFFWWFW